MSDFTIKVYRPSGDPVLPSNVRVIGNQLKVLANELSELAAKGDAQFYRTSQMDDYLGQKSSWTNNGNAAAETLFDSLSFRLYNGDVLEREVGHDDPDKNVHDHVKIIFVFEDEGDMVVPVPTAKNVARGELNTPLRLPSDYDALVSEGTASELGERLVGAINNATDGPLSSITPMQADEIAIELGKVADEMRDELNGDVAFFNAQLGDYSVRQCGG